jgi:hypothetical protein
MFACCSRRVGILASNMAYGVRTESLDRGLIPVCRFSFVSSRECIPVVAQTRSCLQGVCIMLVLLMTAGEAGRLQKGPPKVLA